MVLGIQPHQHRSQQRARRQIERPSRPQFSAMRSSAAVRVSGGSSRRSISWSVTGSAGRTTCSGTPVDGRKYRAQDLVPCDDRGKRVRERAHVQGALEPPTQVHVIARAARLQPVEKPQLALGKRRAAAGSGDRQARDRARFRPGVGVPELSAPAPATRARRGPRWCAPRRWSGPEDRSPAPHESWR